MHLRTYNCILIKLTSLKVNPDIIIGWAERVKARYLSGSDMTLDEFLKLHKVLGNLFNFTRCFLNYIKAKLVTIRRI